MHCGKTARSKRLTGVRYFVLKMKVSEVKNPVTVNSYTKNEVACSGRPFKDNTKYIFRSFKM